MLNAIHDAIDARDNAREAANRAVNEVFDQFIAIAQEITQNGGGFDDLLEEIAAAVAAKLASLTTDAARAGYAASLARQGVSGS